MSAPCASTDFSAGTTFALGDLDDDLPAWSRARAGRCGGWRTRATVPFDAVIGGDIPIGAGLSSSAAVEVVMIELGLAWWARACQVEKALGGVR